MISSAKRAAAPCCCWRAAVRGASAAGPRARRCPRGSPLAVAGAAARAVVADSARVRLEWGAVPTGRRALRQHAVQPHGQGRRRLVRRGVRAGRGVAGGRAGEGGGAGYGSGGGAADRARASTLAAGDIRQRAAGAVGRAGRERGVPGEGWVTRRALAAGDAITPSSVTPPQLVGAAIRSGSSGTVARVAIGARWRGARRRCAR